MKVNPIFQIRKEIINLQSFVFLITFITILFKYLILIVSSTKTDLHIYVEKQMYLTLGIWYFLVCFSFVIRPFRHERPPRFLLGKIIVYSVVCFIIFTYIFALFRCYNEINMWHDQIKTIQAPLIKTDIIENWNGYKISFTIKSQTDSNFITAHYKRYEDALYVQNELNEQLLKTIKVSYYKYSKKVILISRVYPEMNSGRVIYEYTLN